MSRTVKILLGLAVLLLALSYPACHFGEQKVYSEMQKYPPEFVAAHEFDLIFVKWVVPGIFLFFLGGKLILVAFVIWLVQRSRRRTSNTEKPHA